MADLTDSTLSPVSTDRADAAVVAQLLNQILDKAHPLLAEGLYLAAVSPRFDTALFKAMRARDDGRDEKLVARLARFSFITPIEGEDEADSGYAVLATEREILLRRWLATQPEAFVAAHRRALAFRETHPYADPFAQDQSRLYHLLIADGETGLDHLADAFRVYTGERRLAASARLLETATEARKYLVLLGASWLADLDDLLAYLKARLMQFRGRWQESLSRLDKLRQRSDLSSELVPYVVRAYGSALARTGLYVEAIEQYQLALGSFSQQPDGQAEQARTMLYLGDVHLALAVSARGHREVIPPKAGRTQQWLGGFLSLRGLLPLIAYMSRYFGLRMWHPKSWPMLQELDWIIARLFVIGVLWYRRARQLLRALDSRADLVQADEKLAHLYLTMGDAAQAVPLLQTLLKEQAVPLGEYRRASVQASLGRALLRLGKPTLAQDHLQKALPVLRAYDDVELGAQAQGLLAETLLETGKKTEALSQFRQALRLYQRQGDVVGATEIAERLQDLARNWRLDPQDRETASTTTQSLTRRQYLQRFQHPALVTFRRVGLVLLAILVFFIPMLAIHVETESIINADIHFYPSALTAPNPDYSPTLSQTMALNVEPSFEAEFALQRALELLALYLLAYTVLGVILILRTRLRTVQVALAETVRFDLQGLTVGSGEAEQTVRWEDISRISIADVEFLGDPMTDNSMTAVYAPDGELTIKGSTTWYTALQDHIRTFASHAQVVRLGYRVLQSRMGLLYGLSVLSLVLFLLLRTWSPEALLTDFVGPYSLADLYPYLYVGLLLPPFWWLVIRPLQIQMRLNPRSLSVWWVGAAGLALAGLRLVFSQRWLIPPDIYPSLSIVLLLGSAGLVIWKARLPQGGGQEQSSHVYPQWVRVLAVAIAVTFLALVGRHLWREVEAYHFLITGNSQRDESLQVQRQGESAVAAWLQEKALASYTRVLEHSPRNVTALSSRAAIQAQLGRFEDAVADYARALRYAEDKHVNYGYRAMAYESWGLALVDAGDTDAAQLKFAAALSDLDQAVRFFPEDGGHYVQRGAIRHVLKQLDAAQKNYEQALELDPENDQALIAKGWILFQQADDLSDAADREKDEAERKELEVQAQDAFRLALEHFEDAARYASDLPETWLAVGYAYFRLEEYKATIEAWEKAIQLAPDDPVMIISQGMGHWILANVSPCTGDAATEAEKRDTVKHLNLAIGNLNRALELRPDDDYTYRTRAQIEFLLRDCPGYDYQEQIKTAIASYDEALKYAPENDLYWQFRARLGFVLGRDIFVSDPGGESEAWGALTVAAADINRAYALDPQNEQTQLWRDYILNEGWGRYHQARGRERYEAGDYGLAGADMEKAALFLPQDAAVAFDAGLVVLAQEKALPAAEWYHEGLERLTGEEESEVRQGMLQAALDDLAALLEANPRLARLGAPIEEELQAAYDATASN